ncbi:MAG: hypothetical protein QOD95_2785, partial [Gammaproteobacteria bacterium]|nr:hypothetical protein [Gammaproteobacteria bacterium]
MNSSYLKPASYHEILALGRLDLGQFRNAI